MKYLKLGENATSFYDMGTGLKISGKDVVAVMMPTLIKVKEQEELFRAVI